jgi:AcrR family transcriptional regulator
VSESVREVKEPVAAASASGAEQQSPARTAQSRSRKAEQALATRAALIGAATSLFAERGFAGVSAEEIVAAAGVTRGALYHHFDGKQGLFEAVYEDVERRLVEELAQAAMSGRDPLAALHAGAQAFLDACERPEVRRITLIDAPSVLGWQRWREIGVRYGLGVIEATLQAAMDAGLIARQPTRVLAHLLLGAVDEAAMLVAQAHDDDGVTRRHVGEAVDRYIDMLHPPR